MLATGSADGAVRVWDVGQEIMPHAEQWTRVKTRLLYCLPGTAAGRNHGDVDSPSITALENDVIGEENSSNNIAAPGQKPLTAVATDVGAAATMENVRRTLRLLRPELFRQVGARTVWRTGCVTALVDRGGTTHNLPAAATTAVGAKKSAYQPLIEVRNVVTYRGHNYRICRQWLGWPSERVPVT